MTALLAAKLFRSPHGRTTPTIFSSEFKSDLERVFCYPDAEI